ncbi:hypothetical protein C9374_008139 [Naegleria lovaniensis]|uniref:Cyclin-like domain-containing protein n=1 Tax=Naegleria lovaniensis TaxID=51637 RepID=A0AA88GKP2_NAELO|nr:uncharacterized protein C9374_008139 [Naegleria lovaniensis]KAG2378500.1 hypothetical protein C9374_008139 [Naegleria lovaniensis]
MNWYFSEHELSFLPSLHAENNPLNKEQEAEYRRSTASFIQQAGIHLKVPQLTIATSLVFFHRFYAKYEFQKHDRFTVAAACLFLAGKVEETPKKIKNIIESTEHVRKIKYSPNEIDNLTKDIIEKEKLLLKLLNFDFKIEHPYKSVMHYIYNLKKDEKYKDKSKELAQYAWNFVNDSFQTHLCLQYPPRKIAAACIYLSTSQYINMQLPHGWERDEVFKTTHEENEKISKMISSLYALQQPKSKLPFAMIEGASGGSSSGGMGAGTSGGSSGSSSTSNNNNGNSHASSSSTSSHLSGSTDTTMANSESNRNDSANATSGNAASTNTDDATSSLTSHEPSTSSDGASTNV